MNRDPKREGQPLLCRPFFSFQRSQMIQRAEGSRSRLPVPRPKGLYVLSVVTALNQSRTWCTSAIPQLIAPIEQVGHIKVNSDPAIFFRQLEPVRETDIDR